MPAIIAESHRASQLPVHAQNLFLTFSTGVTHVEHHGVRATAEGSSLRLRLGDDNVVQIGVHEDLGREVHLVLLQALAVLGLGRPLPRLDGQELGASRLPNGRFNIT